ncbi:MAG: hypothetical protein F9K32_11115 [Desulfobulbaceae bacterium]|nr:MAG: hypothetical protein F9K32_11115 [Desulfobulbaceae bacterium]
MLSRLLPVLLCLVLLLGGCGGTDYSYRDGRDQKEGPGLLSGKDGVFSVYNTGGGTNDELNIQRADKVTIAATVQAVDLMTRMLTLRGPEGGVFSVQADKQVGNLPQVEVGDEVLVIYVNAVAVRMARPGEFHDESGKQVGEAIPGTKPGVFEISERTVTATIEQIDDSNDTVRLRLPEGVIKVVKVKDPANLDKVRVGDTIVITYTEAVAVSVEKKRN